MTQFVIDIGAAANDGTGDPLRTAFNETNLNFDQVFAAGPVLSNVRIANNTILTFNTNGNLILAPNGVGVVQSNVHIVPNTGNLRNLGSALQRWNTVYTQYVDVSGPATFNQLTVAGNLTVNGNIIQIGNLVTDAKTIQLANTAASANAATGSGITVGANDDIATMLYSSATNAWTFNIGVDTPNIVVNNITSDDSTFVTVQDGLDVQGDVTAETLSVTGNITANTFFGNGSQLTGIASTYGDANVTTFLADFGSNTISTTGNISANYFVGNGSQLTGITNYANANVLALGEAGWSGNIIPSANAVYSLGNSTNYWANLWVAGNTLYIGGVPVGVLGNVLTVNGEAVLSNDSNSSITTTGNVTANNFIGNTEGLIGNITNLTSLNFDVENISARGNAGVNIGAGGNNNLVVLETGVLVQNVPLSVSGNVLGNYFIGDGSQLTGISTSSISNGTSNVDIATANSNVTITANAVTYTFGTDSNLTVAGNINFGGDASAGPSLNDFASITSAANFAVTIDSVNSASTWSFATGDVALGEFDELPLLRTPAGDGSVIYNETLMAILAGNIDAGERSSVRLQEGAVALLGTTSLDGELSTIILEVNTGGVGIRALGDAAPRLSVVGNISGGNILTGGSISATGNLTANNISTGNLTANNISTGNVSATRLQNDGNLEVRANVAGTAKNWTFDTLGDFNMPVGGNISGSGLITANRVSATGNVTGGNLISSATIYGNVDVVLGNIANASATKTRITTDTTFSYIQTGNGTVGSTGNIVFSPYSEPTQRVVIDTSSGNLSAAGNITAQNFTGNISITGNVQGTSANVDLVAGSNTWSFDNTGNLTLPGNTFAVNYANNTPVDVVTRFEGSWNVATGNTTQSFTVDSNNSYQMWLEGNIPNGIIVWNATVTITNTNVPVLGQQFAWNYEGGGNILMFNSIPDQIIGTAGAISNAEPAVANTNVFSFGINNASGSAQTVRYGWIQIS